MPRPRSFFLPAAALVVALYVAPAHAQEPTQQEEAPPPVNVAGEWTITIETQDATVLLEQEGAALTGTLSSPQGSLDVEGEVEGNDLVFWGYFDDFMLAFYGHVADDKKTMEGTLEAGDGEFVVNFMAVKVER